MAKIIMDPEQLAGLKSNYDRQADAVRQIVSVIERDLMSVAWEGRVATQFKDQWRSQYRPTLERLATALNDAGLDIHRARGALLAADRQG